MSNKSVNKVILIGYLGQDPETRYTTNGNIITTINLATSENWKDKKSGEVKEKTEWHRIVFFGKIAEISSEFLKKGYHIYIEGQLQTRKWKDQNNNEKYITEVIVSVNGIMKILNSNKLINDWNSSNLINKNEIKKDNVDFENIKDNFDEDDMPF